jgi:hypothetical protein
MQTTTSGLSVVESITATSVEVIEGLASRTGVEPVSPP